MQKITFGILTYNQEKYVVETLESIKYQKIHYGEFFDVSLIITDDASKDATVQVIRAWLEKNHAYFAKAELIANEKNRGTVANFLTILSKVGEEHLKIIAGDDLIGCKNLFSQYENLNDKKLKTYLRIELCDGVIYCREKFLIDFYYHRKYGKGRNYNLKTFRRGKYLHTPSTLYTKQLFVNAECEESLEGYQLFEDDPMWYSMIKNEMDLEIDFVDQGMVLYRVHNQSVSNAPNPIFQADMKRLRQMYLGDSKGLEYLYLLIRMRTSKWPLYINPGLYLDKFMNMKRQRICRKDPGYQVFKEKIEQQIKEEQKFYDKIMEEISKSAVIE